MTWRYFTSDGCRTRFKSTAALSEDELWITTGTDGKILIQRLLNPSRIKQVIEVENPESEIQDFAALLALHESRVAAAAFENRLRR